MSAPTTRPRRVAPMPRAFLARERGCAWAPSCCCAFPSEQRRRRAKRGCPAAWPTSPSPRPTPPRHRKRALPARRAPSPAATAAWQALVGLPLDLPAGEHRLEVATPSGTQAVVHRARQALPRAAHHPQEPGHGDALAPDDANARRTRDRRDPGAQAALAGGAGQAPRPGFRAPRPTSAERSLRPAPGVQRRAARAARGASTSPSAAHAGRRSRNGAGHGRLFLQRQDGFRSIYGKAC